MFESMSELQPPSRVKITSNLFNDLKDAYGDRFHDHQIQDVVQKCVDELEINFSLSGWLQFVRPELYKRCVQILEHVSSCDTSAL